MERVTVCKEVTFDCAHMLSGHEALCKNLHGHTYKVQVSVTNEQIAEGPSVDMVIDFKHLKEAIAKSIMDKFDHAIIFSSPEFRNEAEEDLFEWACKHHMRLFEMPRRTTAEDMALFFRELIMQDLTGIGYTPMNISIRVYETPTSFAEV